MRRGLLLGVVIGIGAAACIHPSVVRRPLVTDHTPLGTPRRNVELWYRDHRDAWCPVEASSTMLVYRSCQGTEVRVELTFRHDALAEVMVGLRVDPPEPSNVSSVAETPSWQDDPYAGPTHRWIGGSMFDRPADLPAEAMDDLADELVARYGPPQSADSTERRWRLADQDISLQVRDRWVLEAHRARR